jgi:hypothetical protein
MYMLLDAVWNRVPVNSYLGFWPSARVLSTACILLFGAWAPPYMITYFLMPVPLLIYIISSVRTKKTRRLWLQLAALIVGSFGALGITFLVMFLLIPFAVLAMPLGVLLAVFAVLASIPIAYVAAKIFLTKLDQFNLGS